MPGNTANKTVKVFCCAECGETEIRKNTPSRDGCRKYSFHRWVKLGDEGNLKYNCSHCNITVRTAATPSSFGCHEAKFHKWEKK